MATLVISPSSQDANQYVGGGIGFYDSEEYWARLIADQTTADLRAAGHTVHDLRHQILATRIKQSNAIRPDAHIAIHTDAGPPDARGHTIFVAGGASNTSRSLARSLDKALSRAMPNASRGVREYPHYETRHVRAPAVIVEAGFHSNVGEAQFIRENTSRIGSAIAAGILASFPAATKTTKPAPTIPEEEPTMQIITAPGRGQALINTATIPAYVPLATPAETQAASKLAWHKTADLVQLTDQEFDAVAAFLKRGAR